MKRFAAVYLPVVLSTALALPGFAQGVLVRDSTELRKLGAVLGFLGKRNASDYAVTSPQGVDQARYVELGGIPQWISIQGEDRDNPVVLLLHGGPGDVTNPWGYAGFRSWRNRFTVVQWDQRGAGRTLGRNGPSLAPTITIERLARDGVELADSLRRFLGKEKIILVGHSWGSILGVFMVKARPDLFHAFVGTGQVADPARGYTVAHADLLRKAEALRDQRAAEELREVGPPPYPDGRGFAVQRKWSNLFEGADFFLSSTLALALTAPGYSLRDINDWFEGQGISAEQLVPQTSALQASAIAGDFAVPVFVIQGAEDFTTPTSLAREFVQAIRAPRKSFATIDGGGHFAVFMKPEAFLQELEKQLHPLGKLK